VTLNQICYSAAFKRALLKFLVHIPLPKLSGVCCPFFVKSEKRVTLMLVCTASWIAEGKATWRVFEQVEKKGGEGNIRT
jgi:hypothetical protein